MLAAACGGPEVGDVVSQELSLTVRAVSSAPELVAVGEPQGGIGVSRAYLSSSALSFLPCSERVEDLTLGARSYELVHQPPWSELVSTAVSEFCGVRLDLDPLDENRLKDVPKGASLYVEGTDGNGEPFTLTSESSFSLLLETEQDQSFGEVPLLLGFDTSVWLAGLPLAEELATMSVEMLDEQLRASVALYVDADDDGELDEDETAPIARAAAP